MTENTLTKNNTQVNELPSNNCLTSLNDIYKSSGSNVVAALISKNTPPLTEVILENNEISDADAITLASAIKENPTITSVRLESNHLSNTAAEAFVNAIRSNLHIKSVYIEDNNMTDEVAKDLAIMIDSPSLQKCTIICEQLGDPTLEAIAYALEFNRNLKYLVFSKSKASDKGAALIAKALESNHTLTTLELSCYQRSTCEGIKAFENALDKNHSITNLCLYDQNLPLPQRGKIARKIQANQEQIRELAETIVNQKEKIEKGYPFTNDEFQIRLYRNVDQELFVSHLRNFCKKIKMGENEIQHFFSLIPKSLNEPTINDLEEDPFTLQTYKDQEARVLGHSIEHLFLEG